MCVFCLKVARRDDGLNPGLPVDTVTMMTCCDGTTGDNAGTNHLSMNDYE